MVELSTARRPTIADIAARAGVSKGAVSYALNGLPGVSEETRARVLAIADELGWHPNAAARSLSGSRAHAVGLVIARPAAYIGVEPFFMQFVAGLEAELSAAGHALLLQLVGSNDEAVDAYRRWWGQRRIDGVIVTDLWVDDPRIAALQEIGLPAVVAGGPGEGVGLPSVPAHDESSTDAAVEHLVGLGHRRVGRVAGLPHLHHTVVRSQAFLAAARRHGLDDAPVVDTDFSGDEGARATRELLSRPQPPTAIVYDNDVMAVAGLGAAREMGVAVPDELSIVSYEDSLLCRIVHPMLTALSRDTVAFGAHTARTLLDLLTGDGDLASYDATATLVVRGSTVPTREQRP